MHFTPTSTSRSVLSVEKLKNLYFTAGETPAKLCVLFIVWLVEWVSTVVGKTVRGERSSEGFFFPLVLSGGTKRYC